MLKLLAASSVLFALAPPPALASTILSTVNTSIVHSVYPENNSASTTGTGQVTSTRVVSNPYIQYDGAGIGENVYFGGSAYAAASTNYGVMKAFSSASGVATEKYTHPLIVTAEATSQVYDSLRITAPGIADGSEGVLKVGIYWESTSTTVLASGANAYAPSRGSTTTYMTVFLGGGFYSGSSSVDYSSSSIASSNCKADLETNRNIMCNSLITPIGTKDFFNTSNDLEIPFIFGDRINLSMTLKTSIEGWARSTFDYTTGATILNTFDAVADASHSGYWDGIHSVMFNGAEILYEVQSDSGTDYRQSFVPTVAIPVPEPRTVSMLMAGIGLMTLVLRRRHRRSA